MQQFIITWKAVILCLYHLFTLFNFSALHQKLIYSLSSSSHRPAPLHHCVSRPHQRKNMGTAAFSVAEQNNYYVFPILNTIGFQEGNQMLKCDHGYEEWGAALTLTASEGLNCSCPALRLYMSTVRTTYGGGTVWTFSISGSSIFWRLEKQQEGFHWVKWLNLHVFWEVKRCWSLVLTLH